MAPAKPSLELLRSLSDEHVVRALMSQRQATRAEIAVATGLSKPTVSESVRRLSAAGVVVDTGARTTGRGRIGTYYGLPATIGCALVVGIAPEGVVAEAVDVYGEIVARSRAGVSRAPGERHVAHTLQRVAGEVAGRCAGPIRLAVVSAADPVDRATGRLVELPDAPFLVGALDAPAVLAELVEGPVTVDNDVNWMARAEHGGRDFVYVFLGEGVGRRGGRSGARRAGARVRSGAAACPCRSGRRRTMQAALAGATCRTRPAAVRPARRRRRRRAANSQRHALDLLPIRGSLSSARRQRFVSETSAG